MGRLRLRMRWPAGTAVRDEQRATTSKRKATYRGGERHRRCSRRRETRRRFGRIRCSRRRGSRCRCGGRRGEAVVGGVDALLRRRRRQRRLPVQPTVSNHQLNLRARKGRLFEEESPVDRLRALFDEGVQWQRRLPDGHVRLHHTALSLAHGQLSDLFLVRTRGFLVHGRL